LLLRSGKVFHLLQTMTSKISAITARLHLDKAFVAWNESE